MGFWTAEGIKWEILNYLKIWLLTYLACRLQGEATPFYFWAYEEFEVFQMVEGIVYASHSHKMCNLRGSQHSQQHSWQKLGF